MKTVLMADPVRYPRMTTEELRETFLLGSLCEPGKLHLIYVDLDRSVVGFAAPTDSPITLPTYPELRANYFTERRELGALNTGGAGSITVDSKTYDVNNLDVLYIGRGSKDVSFASKDKSAPAVFYILSYPAHAEFPTALVRKEDASPVELGSVETCNKRTICKYIHLQGARSCQLVMGVTHLAPGSNWNTMPASSRHFLSQSSSAPADGYSSQSKIPLFSLRCYPPFPNELPEKQPQVTHFVCDPRATIRSAIASDPQAGEQRQQITPSNEGTNCNAERRLYDSAMFSCRRQRVSGKHFHAQAGP